MPSSPLPSSPARRTRAAHGPVVRALLAALILLGIAAPAAAVPDPGPAAPTAGAGVGRGAAPADSVKPTAPGNLTAQAYVYGARLRWTASRDNVKVVAYRVRVGTQVKKVTTLAVWFGGLTPNRTYNGTVNALDRAGNVSAPAKVTFTTKAAPGTPTDTTAPSAPTGLTASAVTQTGATLTWAAATDNVAVTAYDVSANGATQTVSGTTATLSGLSPATGYPVRVVARDAAGNTSGAATLTVTTAAVPDTTAPGAPTGLAASAVTQTGATLTWTAATDNVGVTAYAVTANGGTQTVTGTTATLSGLSPATAYPVRVVARDAAGNTSPAATLTVTTLAPADTEPPGVPGDISTDTVGQTTATISWAGVADADVAHYEVRAGGLTLTTTDTSRQLGGLTPDTAYRVEVRAVDTAGNASAPTGINFRTGDSATYLRGNIAWFGARVGEKALDAALASDLVDGVSVITRWNELTSDGVTYDFSGLDRVAAAAQKAGKPWAGALILGTQSNGLPAYVQDNLPQQEWITTTDSKGTHTFPVFWSAYAQREANALLAKVAERYRDDPNLLQWRVTGLWRTNAEPWFMGGAAGRVSYLEKYQAQVDAGADFAAVQDAYNAYERDLWDEAAAVWPQRIRLAMAAGDAMNDNNARVAIDDPARHPRRLANWTSVRAEYGNRAVFQFNGMNDGDGAAGYGAWLPKAVGRNGEVPGRVGAQPIGGIIIDTRMNPDTWREMTRLLVQRKSDYCEFYGADVRAAIDGTDPRAPHMAETLRMYQGGWQG